MSRWRCNACDGEYDDVGADGMSYYHACAPLTVFPLVPGTEGPREERVRPDARNENLNPRSVTIVRATGPGGSLFHEDHRMPLKAEGKGRKKLG